MLGCFVRLCYICQAKKTTHYDNIYSMPTGVDSSYFTYGRLMERVFGPDDRKTPALTKLME